MVKFQRNSEICACTRQRINLLVQSSKYRFLSKRQDWNDRSCKLHFTGNFILQGLKRYQATDKITFVLVETPSRYSTENDLDEKAVGRPGRNSGERGSGLALDHDHEHGEKWVNSKKD